MGTKKKKTQLKPVARGFATTSVPKKVVPAVDAAVEGDSSHPDAKGPDAKGDDSSSTDAPKNVDGTSGPEDQDVDPIVQGFVDKYQDRTEKDIVRTIKVCF